MSNSVMPKGVDRKESPESLIEVDKNRLDEELVNQPRRYYHFAKRMADAKEQWEYARADKDILEDELKEVDAQLSLAIRKDPPSFGLEKVTEDAIKHTVLTHRKHAVAQVKVYEKQKEIIKLRHLVDILEAAVKALDNRKMTLESLTYLQNANYYATPRLPPADKERVQKMERDAAFGKGREK